MAAVQPNLTSYNGTIPHLTGAAVERYARPNIERLDFARLVGHHQFSLDGQEIDLLIERKLVMGDMDTRDRQLEVL